MADSLPDGLTGWVEQACPPKSATTTFGGDRPPLVPIANEKIDDCHGRLAGTQDLGLEQITVNRLGTLSRILDIAPVRNLDEKSIEEI